MKTGILIFLMAAALFTGCEKQSTAPKAQTFPDNAMWVSPTGFAVSYGDRENWEEIRDRVLNGTEKAASYWESRDCQTPEVRCGLECIKSTKKYANCDKETVCTVCAACGCTPVVSPYNPS